MENRTDAPATVGAKALHLDRRFELLLWIVIAAGLLAWWGFGRSTGIVLEDALITYRHAENLALGRGFGFNPGHPVLGTTTPLFTLVLSAGALAFGVNSIPTLSSIVLMSCSAGATWFTAHALRRLGMNMAVALVASIAVVFHPSVLWSTSGGMETPLVLLCMAGSGWALAAARPSAAALFAGLLVLTRPDGAIWAGLILAVLLSRDLRRAWIPLAAFLAVTLPWIAYATTRFGSPIPQSLLAKATVVGRPPLTELVRPANIHSFTQALARWTPFPPDAGLSPFEFVLGTILIVLGAYHLVRRSQSPARWVFVMFPLAFGAAYHMGRAPMVFPWYGVPWTWSLLVLFAVGFVETVVQVMFSNTNGVLPWHRYAAVGLSAWLAFGVAYEIHCTYKREKAYQQNEKETRQKIGEWLRDHTLPDTRVAMEAIGYQGVYSNRYVIDLAGLISPDVTQIRARSRSNAEAFRRVLEELRPEYLVLRSYEVDQDRHFHGGKMFENDQARAAFLRMFEEKARFEAPHPELWGDSASLTVYGRVRLDARNREYPQ